MMGPSSHQHSLLFWVCGRGFSVEQLPNQSLEICTHLKAISLHIHVRIHMFFAMRACIHAYIRMDEYEDAMCLSL